jgi:hypothetical protein
MADLFYKEFLGKSISSIDSNIKMLIKVNAITAGFVVASCVFFICRNLHQKINSIVNNKEVEEYDKRI